MALVDINTLFNRSTDDDLYYKTAMTNQSFNNMSQCQSLYSGRMYIGHPWRSFLVFSMTLSLVLSLFLNSGVVYSLIKTKQLNNTSMKLILCLSVSDLLLAVLGQPLFVIMLVRRSWDVDNCVIDTLVEFLVLLFAHTSAYIVLLIGYDRYYRMRYLTRYSEMIKHWYLKVFVLIIIVLSIIQVLMQVVGIQMHFYNVAAVIAIAVDGCIIGVMLVPYVLTMFTMKQHVRKASNRSMLSKVDRVISAMTVRILIAILVMYTPYVVFCVTRTIIEAYKPMIAKTEWLNVCLFVGYTLGCSNSFVNAIIFISLNRKTRKLLFGSCRTFVGRENMSELTSFFLVPKNGKREHAYSCTQETNSYFPPGLPTTGDPV